MFYSIYIPENCCMPKETFSLYSLPPWGVTCNEIKAKAITLSWDVQFRSIILWSISFPSNSSENSPDVKLLTREFRLPSQIYESDVIMMIPGIVPVVRVRNYTFHSHCLERIGTLQTDAIFHRSGIMFAELYFGTEIGNLKPVNICSTLDFSIGNRLIGFLLWQMRK